MEILCPKLENPYKRTKPEPLWFGLFLISAIGLYAWILKIKLLRSDSNNINQIAKTANTCGTVDDKTISVMEADHERVLKKVERCFDKFLKIM